MSGGYEQIPGTSADSYQAVDPNKFTQQAGQNIFGGPAQGLINQGMGAMGAWSAPTGSADSFMSKYLSDFGGLQGAITDATSPLNQQLQNQMQQNIKTGMSQAGQAMSGLGGLRSSAMGEAAGDVVGRAATDASTQLANAQLGLLGQQGGQAMGQRGAALSQMMGMPLGMMGLQGQFGEPMYAAPQYAQRPGALDWISGIGSAIGGIGGAISPFF